MITDRNIDWKRKTKYFTIGDLLNAMTTPTDGGATAFDPGELLQSAAGTDGNAPEIALKELSTFGISGLQFTATTANLLAALLRLPTDLDPKFPIGIRYHYSASAAASAGRGVTWTTFLNAVAKGAVLLTVASIVTAMDTAFGNSLNTGANFNEWSDRGLKKLALTKEQIESGAVLQISIETVHNSSPGTITLFGLELDYVPYMCQGTGSEYDRPIRANSVTAL